MRVESSRRTGRATPEFQGIPSLNALHQMTVRAAPQALGLKCLPNAVPIMPRTNGNLSRHQSTAGFLLIDPSLSPIPFNAEAVQILGYPNKFASIRQSRMYLARKIRSLTSRQPSRELHFVTEFRSGHRRYLWHAFVVDSRARGRFCPSIACCSNESYAHLWSCQEFASNYASRREREALEHLLHGLSSKKLCESNEL
jgi:hypothetical protein